MYETMSQSTHIPLLLSTLMFLCCETGSHHVAQVLTLKVLRLRSGSLSWDGKCVPPHPDSFAPLKLSPVFYHGDGQANTNGEAVPRHALMASGKSSTPVFMAVSVTLSWMPCVYREAEAFILPILHLKLDTHLGVSPQFPTTKFYCFLYKPQENSSPGVGTTTALQCMWHSVHCKGKVSRTPGSKLLLGLQETPP